MPGLAKEGGNEWGSELCWKGIVGMFQEEAAERVASETTGVAIGGGDCLKEHSMLKLMHRAHCDKPSTVGVPGSHRVFCCKTSHIINVHVNRRKEACKGYERGGT